MVFFLALLLLSLCDQVIQACGKDDQVHCDARHYGHRRTVTHSPCIYEENYGSYFQEQAKKAQILRQQLIISGAFKKPLSDEQSYVSKKLIDNGVMPNEEMAGRISQEYSKVKNHSNTQQKK